MNFVIVLLGYIIPLEWFMFDAKYLFVINHFYFKISILLQTSQVGSVILTLCLLYYLTYLWGR